jgi:uncharacterized membrane protein YhaH (DUF805 family)
MEWYLKVVRDNYANFAGRARRKEYWMFVLFNMIFAIVAMIIDNILGTTFNIGDLYSLPYGWLYLLYVLGIIIPSLAVLVRRLHDVGKSGWWFFIVFSFLSVQMVTPAKISMDHHRRQFPKTA